MTISKAEVNEIRSDVAAKLIVDIHSSAKENIISSLLAASLNESEKFRKWFCKRVELNDAWLAKKLYAGTNDSIPPKLRTKKLTPLHPDLLLYSRQDAYWNKLYDLKEKLNWGNLAKEIRAIFVEVKHTGLSDRDKKKYCNLITNLFEACNHDNVRFVLISSHSELTANKIRGAGQKSSLGVAEQTWYDLLHFSLGTSRDQLKPVHITLEEIYNGIMNDLALKSPEYKNHHILQIFRHYLAIYTGQTQDQACINDWKLYKDYCKTDYLSLKIEILNYIKWIAIMAGIRPMQQKNLADAEIKAEAIKVYKDKNEYRMKINKGRKKCMDFELSVENTDKKPIRFSPKQDTGEEIAKNIGRVKNLFQKLG
ncbi:hypothetical protein ACFLVI_03405 [Chloroflexota bacterium]